MQRRETTLLRGDWIPFGEGGKGVKQGWRQRKGRSRGPPGLGSGPQRGGHRTVEKTAEAGRGLRSAAHHTGGVWLPQPLSPAPAALWGWGGDARACGGLHKLLALDGGRARPPTRGHQPSAAPGLHAARDHIRCVLSAAPPPGLPRGPEWCGPARPLTPARGGSLPVT